MKMLTTLIFVVILTIIEAFAQIIINKYYTTKNKNTIWYYPFVAATLYGSVAFILLKSYDYADMANMDIYWNAGSSLLIPLAGMLLFSEVITFYGWIGIILTIIGATMLSFNSHT